MKKHSRVRELLKKIFTKNPISYLGWLGFLGVFGIFFAPVVTPFLLCFSFFSYCNMVADELFWENVHIAAARAFGILFILDTFVIIVMLYRGMSHSFGGESIQPIMIESGTASLAVFTLNQYVIAYFAFLLNLLLLVLVFSISMMRFKSQEKKSLKEQDA